MAAPGRGTLRCMLLLQLRMHKLCPQRRLFGVHAMGCAAGIARCLLQATKSNMPVLHSRHPARSTMLRQGNSGVYYVSQHRSHST